MAVVRFKLYKPALVAKRPTCDQEVAGSKNVHSTG